MALSNHSFESKHWAKFNQFQSDHEIAPEILEKQIIKLSNTSHAIEAKDLQYRVLRNTCITNNKLYKMKILDTPNCTLCNHQTQDSTHHHHQKHHHQTHYHHQKPPPKTQPPPKTPPK